MVAKATARPPMSAVSREPGRVPRTPLKRRAGGLSRFYKAKAQSFSLLSDALNTEWGESALGLAKRLKISHPVGECVKDVCRSQATNHEPEAEQQSRLQLLQKYTEEACAMLESLNVGCPVGTMGNTGNVCSMGIVTDLKGIGGGCGSDLLHGSGNGPRAMEFCDLEDGVGALVSATRVFQTNPRIEQNPNRDQEPMALQFVLGR